jgi:hypothetical protein
MEYMVHYEFDPRCSRPHLYVESSMAGLWDNSLRGGMSLISGTETTLETFFDLHTVLARRPFEWEGIKLEVIPAVHVLGPHRIMHSYGLLIGDGEQQAFLTTDTQFTPGHLSSSYGCAGLIFHDCETGKVKTGIHSHYDDLAQLPAAIRARSGCMATNR